MVLQCDTHMLMSLRTHVTYVTARVFQHHWNSHEQCSNQCKNVQFAVYRLGTYERNLNTIIHNYTMLMVNTYGQPRNVAGMTAMLRQIPKQVSKLTTMVNE